MSRRRTVVAVLALVPLVVSCQLLLKRNIHADPDLVSTESPVDPCKHALPPPAPDASDGDSVGDLWFATQRIIVPLGEDAGVKPGLDLDDSCTCMPDLHDGGPPCETPAITRTSCDFDGGVDDALGAAALQYAPFLKGNFDLAGSVNARVDQGYRTFLLYLTDYNGQANDPSVNVAVITSGGLYDKGGCNDPTDLPGPLDPDQRAALLHPPLWDGCDRWSPVPNTVVPATRYPNRAPLTTPAYVSNYNIVGHLDSIGAGFLGSTAALRQVVAVATIIPEGAGKYRLEGLLAGRMAFTDATALVGSSASVDSDGGKGALCNTTSWPLVSTQLCAARDTVLDPRKEFNPPTNVCDAVTVTLGFVARSAQVSNDEYAPPPQSVDECDASVACP